MGSRITRALVAAVGLGAIFGVPAIAHAAEAVQSVPATQAYQLDFTLPTESKSGCLVCHGDPALVRVRDGVIVSYFIDAKTVAASAHTAQQCVGCHVDFIYKAPHGEEDWTVTAKTACRNCHDAQSVAIGVGVHRAAVTTATPSPGGATAPAGTAPSAETTPAPRPLCGDCHGSHDITVLTTDTPAARANKATLHQNGWQICGRCHQDYWDNYNDYYHGAAYKRGAADAPSCWDCHGWHDILPSDNRGSSVNPAHLVETCGQDGCHTGVDETYTEYAAFVHGREKVTADNPVHALMRKVTGFFGRLFGRKDGS